MEQYFSQVACEQRVEKALSGEQVPSRLYESVAAAIARELYVAPAEAVSDGFELKAGSWVIRDEDLNVLDVIKDGVLLTLATGASMPSAIVSLAVSVSRFVWSLHRRGAKLKGDSLAVFTHLKKQNQEQSIEEISAALGTGWTHERVSASLDTLSALVVSGGTAELAKRLPNGRWVAVA